MPRVVEATSGITTTRLLIDCRLLAARARDAAGARRARAPATSTPSSSPTSTATTSAARVTLAERHDLPVWMSRGTWRAIGESARAGAPLRSPATATTIAVGDLELQPVHGRPRRRRAAAAALQRRRSAASACSPTSARSPSTCSSSIAGCDALLLECNHDEAMLAASRYPPSLKARIGGRYGHLSNATRGRDRSARHRRRACATSSPPT